MKDLFLELEALLHPVLPLHFINVGCLQRLFFLRLADPDRSDCYIPLPDVTLLRSSWFLQKRCHVTREVQPPPF